MRMPFFAFNVALVLGFSAAACRCGGPLPGEVTEDDAGDSNLPDGSTMTDLDGGLCLVSGQSCQAGSSLPCCNGLCDNGTCKALCAAFGGSCSQSSECCNGVQCSPDGTCSGPKCTDTGGACSSASDCCTNNCGAAGDGGMTCQAIPGQGGSCKVLGSTCAGGAECCSSLCRFGACAAAASCRAYNEVCGKGTDCCSGLCSVNDGGSGYCITPTGGPGCDQAGTPCSSGTNCCTKVCADLGTGAAVCQPVGGCRVAGDYCANASSCCGGEPNGTVSCTNQLKCDNGQSCRAPGTICGKPVNLDGGQVRTADGGLFTVNNETNCCGGYKIMGDEQTCRLDTAGVPRCFGGGSSTCPSGYTGTAPCCIAENDVCDFKDQCCDGALCVQPSDGGVRRCTKSTCGNIGTPCTSSSTCCAGTECLATSELSKACQIPPTASMPDAGSCKPNTASCTAGSQCCSGVCTGGTCAAAAACQGADGVCNGPQDCCVGLSCTIPSGATTGKCTTGATCSDFGQTCSTSAACCTGLACKDSSGAACNGTTQCACQVTIN